MKLFIAFSFLVSIALSVEKVKGNVVTRSVDDDYHCKTDLNITIPPCVCTGYEDVVRENIRLDNELKELKKSIAETETSKDCIGNDGYVYIIML